MAGTRKPLPRRHVVLDGPLIVHGGAGGEGQDGRRLSSAFEWYEKLGYTVEATISKKKLREFIEGIYFSKEGDKWVRKEKKPIVGAASLKRLVADNKLAPFGGDDDKVMLDKCVDTSKKAWIVTHDKFDDRVEGDSVIKRQRSKYPDLPWGEIDEFTRGTFNKDGRIISNQHWRVDGKNFYDHEMPRAPPSILYGKYSEIDSLANNLTQLLSKIDGVLEGYAESNLENKSSMRTRVQKMQIQASAFIELIPKEELGEGDISALSVKNLRILAKERGLSGYSKMKKAELIRLILDDIPSNKEISDLTIDNTELDKSKEDFIREKTANIEPAEFFENLFSKMENPNQWGAFTTPYSLMIADKPEFHLKSLGVKPVDFIRLHADKIELSLRKGHPWVRRK